LTHDTIQEDILRLATAKEVTLTCAESCTGGMLAAALTDLPGSSAMFEYGFVTYSNVAKVKLLNVKQETLDLYGAVSEPTVCEMALGALLLSEADFSVAISGIAGPGGSDHKPEGRVCFALARRGEGEKPKVSAETVEFGALGRDQVRQVSQNHALELFYSALS